MTGLIIYLVGSVIAGVLQIFVNRDNKNRKVRLTWVDKIFSIGLAMFLSYLYILLFLIVKYQDKVEDEHNRRKNISKDDNVY